MNIRLLSLLATLFMVASLTAQSASYFINEISYTASNPLERGFEIAGPANEQLQGWSVIAYDLDGWQQEVIDLSNQVIPNQQNGYGTIWYDIDQAGDGGGLALIDANGTVQQFVAYGTSLGADLLDGALNGPLAGVIPQHIGSALGDTQSLQLIGTGTVYSTFFWAGSQAASASQVNDNQYFILSILGLQSAGTSSTPEMKPKAWPNPTTDFIQLQVPSAEFDGQRILSLYDQNGRQLIRRSVSADAQVLELEVSQFPAGIYYLSMYGNSNFWQSEVVLQ